MRHSLYFLFKWILICALLSITFACGDENEDGYPPIYWNSKHLHNCYTIPDSFSHVKWHIVPSRRRDSFAIGFSIKGDIIYSDECKVPKNTELFDSICQLYHDTAWHGESSATNPPIAYPVSDISIISDADFDVVHPAGSDLIDFATVRTESWGDFVLNGYPINDTHLVYISKKFSDFTYNEKCLWWDGGISLVFPLPTLSTTHHLTISITFEGGKKISSTIEVIL